MAEPLTIRRIQTDLSEPALRTAAEELARFLSDHQGRRVIVRGSGTPRPQPQPGTVIISTPPEAPRLTRSTAEPPPSRIAADPDHDAFEVAAADGCIVIVGSNPRAALYGVFELEDVIARHGRVPETLEMRGSPAMDLRLLHPRVRGGFLGYRRSDFEFIARCGANVAHLSHDWMSEKTLMSFVPSAELPDATPPDVRERNRDALRRYLAWCDEFGLRAALWLCEMPCQGGAWMPESSREAFLTRFPAECLSDSGTGQGKVLCLGHPLVEQAYRAMTRRLLREFPQIAMVLVFTCDSNGEFCDPDRCERHRGVSKLVQYGRLLALLAEEGRAVRPDFRVLTVGWGWHFRNDPDFLALQTSLPAGTGLTSPPDGEAWSFDRKLTEPLLASCRAVQKAGQIFLGYDIVFWGDDTVFPETELYDFPLGLAAKLRRWGLMGADGFFDQWGTQAEYVPANAIALRHFIFHPETTSPRAAWAFARRLARDQYGPQAAAAVAQAWQEIEAAQRVQSDHTYYWHLLRPAWSGPVLDAPLTLQNLQQITLSGAEPPKAWRGRDYAPHRDDVARARALGTALGQAAEHFARAMSLLEQALEAMPADQQSVYRHWHTPEAGAPPRLTPREQLEKQLVAVRLQARTQRRMSRFYGAWAAANSLPAEGMPGRLEALAEFERFAGGED
ncbi:MAG: hypothetical protein HPY69_02050 [Armatimonadetes bacterium]|nr:hypothetical protein [Armatimonadota bacterium]